MNYNKWSILTIVLKKIALLAINPMKKYERLSTISLGVIIFSG